MQFFFFLFRWVNMFSCRFTIRHIIHKSSKYTYSSRRCGSATNQSLYRARATHNRNSRNKMWSKKAANCGRFDFFEVQTKQNAKPSAVNVLRRKRKEANEKKRSFLSFTWPLSEWLCARGFCWTHAHLRKFTLPWNTLATWSRRFYVHTTEDRHKVRTHDTKNGERKTQILIVISGVGRCVWPTHKITGTRGARRATETAVVATAIGAGDERQQNLYEPKDVIYAKISFFSIFSGSIYTRRFGLCSTPLFYLLSIRRHCDASLSASTSTKWRVHSLSVLSIFCLFYSTSEPKCTESRSRQSKCVCEIAAIVLAQVNRIEEMWLTYRTHSITEYSGNRADHCI